MIRLLLALGLALPLFAAEPTVRVRVGAATREMPLERYVAAVLAGESSIFQSPEALKAMAAAARTYAVRLRGRHSAEGFDFCATTHCQHIDLAAVAPRLEAAAAETSGELLWYQGKPAFTAYTRDCGGRSEEAAAVWPDLAAPYLKSHDDPWCGSPAWRWSPDPLDLAAALRRSNLRTPPSVEQVAIADRTASGRARTLVLSGRGESVRISAGSFRFAVGRQLGWNWLPSDRYEARDSTGRPRFEGKGSGHGVGLCQRGADRMGLAGRSYREILAFYYPGAEAGLTARGLSWQRLGGERIALFTTVPDRDRPVLALAERLLREASQRSALPAPDAIEIRLYPDIDSFRNATAEPGWVAAHTAGRRIHLQPAHGTLEPVLRHELFHVLLESQARPGLPLWFREGLVGVLEGRARAEGSARIPTDADLRQTADPARARRAYAEASRAAAALVRRYGLASVLGWLKTGLPPEVTNSSSSHEAVKSR